VRVKRFRGVPTAAEVRSLAPSPPGVEGEVREIIDAVRAGGDAAVLALTERFDHAEVAPDALAVPEAEVEAAVGALEASVREALLLAIANVRAVARAQRTEAVEVELAQGQRIEVAEVPLRRVGAYVPGGRAPYPSTVVMCAVTARAAGVEQIAVCAPPGPGGRAHPVILGACGLCGVTEVYRMGGAQAIAALALGTETVAPVDLIVGPGNRYVQEAKRQLFGTVAIDGLAGPSELVVLATEGADPELVAADLLAQAEHGPGSLLALLSDDRRLLAEVERAVERGRRAGEGHGASTEGAALALVQLDGARAGLALAEAIAPEHLELVGADAEALAARVRSAGCLFVGRDGAAAFGDYVAGSNHVLPTGGAARFQSGLSAATFRRRMARVSLPPGTAARLATAGAALAKAEGFPLHAESMSRRA